MSTWLAHRPELAVLPLHYDRVVADPRGTAEGLAEFLGRPFDVAAGRAAAVEPALKRNRGRRRNRRRPAVRRIVMGHISSG